MEHRLIVESSGPVLGLWDLCSPSHKPGRYDQSWETAWEFERDPPGAASWKPSDMDAALERFAQYWNHRQARGELLAWQPGSGVYCVEVRVLPRVPGRAFTKAQQAAFLTGAGGEKVLHCPSGELTVACLKSLGQERSGPIIKVLAGEYRAGMDISKEQLTKPRPFRTSSEYPVSYSPDFTIYLQEK
ncbi:MAG: hypothetical protein HY924_11805 [Elusimicrobia bacterium]|nr:hypothetical protein [Elusimicrobiota bacterium]